MKTVEHDDPGFVQLHPVEKGESIPVSVEGGIHRKPAPCRGFRIETLTQSSFVPETVIIEKLRELGWIIRR